MAVTAHAGAWSPVAEWGRVVDHATAARHHVLDDQHRLAGRELEATPQHEDIVFLLGENVARLGMARDLLPDDQPAHRRREHGGEFHATQFGGEQLRQSRDGGHVLAHLRALEVVAAVQTGAEHKMAAQQRAGARENIEYLGLG